MFTMRDYLVLTQGRREEIARAQHHNWVKGVCGRSQIDRLLARLGALLMEAGRSLQGSAAEPGCAGPPAGRAGVSVA